MFFGMKPVKRNPRNVEMLTDTELRNKICESKRGERGNCKGCEVYDMCRVGKELMKRGMLH